MPSIVTHHYFAKDILNKLNNETKQTFQNSYSIFLIFAQSFDNLFYYKLLTPWLGKKERTLGYDAQKIKVNLPEFYSCFNKKMPFFSVIMGNYDIFYIVQSKYLNFSFEYMIFK